jgi:hypothetical protein
MASAVGHRPALEQLKRREFALALGGGEVTDLLQSAILQCPSVGLGQSTPFASVKQ